MTALTYYVSNSIDYFSIVKIINFNFKNYPFHFKFKISSKKLKFINIKKFKISIWWDVRNHELILLKFYSF